MKSTFQWRDYPSWLAAELARKYRKPDLTPKRYHEYSAAHATPIAPPVTDDDVKFADSMWSVE